MGVAALAKGAAAAEQQAVAGAQLAEPKMRESRVETATLA
jgi:hypothetical protein